MLYLLIVSLIWAFSFGIIKDHLTGLDPNFVSFARLFIALVIFLPLLRWRNLRLSVMSRLMFVGMIQYGLMYITYIFSFRYLQAYQVALFTIFTPLYVTLIHDLLQRKLHHRFLISALLSVAGTAIILFNTWQQVDLRLGFLLMQISNLCFAFGQIYYRRLMAELHGCSDASVFALLYLGAVLLTGLVSLFTTDYSYITLQSGQIYALLYLGILASGISFFLWNVGARKTNAGILAVFNNIKIPLAVAVSLLFFKEEADLTRLLGGGVVLIVALLINHDKFFKTRV